MDLSLLFLCSLAGVSRPVKIKHTPFTTPEANAGGKRSTIAARFARTMLVLLLALVTIGGFAQQPQTIDQIRVIGNRRIPKETVLARLFTHVGDTYDPISIERDFNSLVEHGLFRESAHRARGLGEGHHPERVCAGEADHPRDQLSRPEHGIAVGPAGPVQESKKSA